LPTDIWKHRELLRRLVWRNIAVRYQRSVLGLFWALLNPLLAIALLVGVFGFIVRIQVASYWAFLLSGYFVWVYVVHTLTACATVLSEHASMVKGLKFPTELLVIGQALSRLLEFSVELILVVGALVLFRHHGLPSSLVLLPLLVVAQLLLVVGLALPAAALAVFFRDVQHGLPVALTMVGYLSPVYYPITMVPAGALDLYRLNPFARLLELYHITLYEGRWPPMIDMAVVLTFALFVAGVGGMVFRKLRPTLPEVI
jgi:ABC-type polysaccharide/polyol phosphate export permease